MCMSGLARLEVQQNVHVLCIYGVNNVFRLPGKNILLLASESVEIKNVWWI